MKSTVDFLIAILKLIPGRNAINPLTFLQKSKRNGTKRCLIPLDSLNSMIWIQALTCSKTIKYMDKGFNVEPFQISEPIDMDSNVDLFQKSKRNGVIHCLIPLESLNSSVWIQALTCSKTIKYMDKSFNVEPFEISKPIDMDSSVDLFQKSKRNGAKRCLIPLESLNPLIWILTLTSFRNQRGMELFIASFL